MGTKVAPYILDMVAEYKDNPTAVLLAKRYRSLTQAIDRNVARLAAAKNVPNYPEPLKTFPQGIVQHVAKREEVVYLMALLLGEWDDENLPTGEPQRTACVRKAAELLLSGDVS